MFPPGDGEEGDQRVWGKGQVLQALSALQDQQASVPFARRFF